MKLSREEVLRIALLARLGISEEDVEKFRLQLSNILENFDSLQQVDASSLPPTAQSIALSNVFREDTPKPSCSVKQILANAPKQENNFLKVQAVLD